MAVWSYTQGRTEVDGYQWHFYGGKQYSAPVLFATLFSTIFSAYTIDGVPNESSLLGFIALRWLTGSIIVNTAAMVLTPRTYRLSTDRRYLSPNDLVSDRYNNRVLTVLMCLTSAAAAVVYVLSQFYAMRSLIEGASGGTLDAEGVIWLIAAVMLASEWMGGFNAVSYTDAVQSFMMIAAFVIIPMAVGHYYGNGAGAADSVELGCPNFQLLNCTDPAFAAFGSSCAGRDAVPNGCLAEMTTAQSNTLYPPLGAASFFKPLTEFWRSGLAWYGLQTMLPQVGSPRTRTTSPPTGSATPSTAPRTLRTCRAPTRCSRASAP